LEKGSNSQVAKEETLLSPSTIGKKENWGEKRLYGAHCPDPLVQFARGESLRKKGRRAISSLNARLKRFKVYSPYHYPARPKGKRDIYRIYFVLAKWGAKNSPST